MTYSSTSAFTVRMKESTKACMGRCHCVEWRYKNIFSSFEAWRYSETLPKISSEKWMKELLRSCHSFTPYVNDFEKFHTNERAVLPEYYWNNKFLTLNTSKTSTSKSKCNNNMMSFKVSVNLTWWTVAQSIVRHAPNIYQCVCARVTHSITQVWKYWALQSGNINNKSGSMSGHKSWGKRNERE